jgi:hypothetical protein
VISTEQHAHNRHEKKPHKGLPGDEDKQGYVIAHADKARIKNSMDRSDRNVLLQITFLRGGCHRVSEILPVFSQ